MREKIAQPPDPILVAHLFPKVEAHLIELLRSLMPPDWERPTICPGWRVKDVAAHLLDTNIRNLSMRRDAYFREKPEGMDSYEGLVRFLDRLNADWVKAARRMIPRVLIDWMEATSREVCEFNARLDPFAKAPFPVAWAGEAESLNWFDLAREFTERWHHQQQIRLAVDRPGITSTAVLMTRELYYPVVDTFMRALPRTYASVEAPQSTALKVVVTGDAGGTWFLIREANAWRLTKSEPTSVAANVSIPQDLAWQLFTKGIKGEERRKALGIKGDVTLGERFLRTIAVMA